MATDYIACIMAQLKTKGEDKLKASNDQARSSRASSKASAKSGETAAEDTIKDTAIYRSYVSNSCY